MASKSFRRPRSSDGFSIEIEYHDSGSGIARLETNPSRAAARLPTLFRLFVPSVADLIFVLLLTAMTYGAMAPRLLGDASIGWHIRNGQQMLLTHSITRTDSFSVTKSGQAWYAWEWLYDLTIVGIHDRLGLNGVVFFTALVIAATFALTLRLALSRGAGLPVAIVFLILSVGASTIHFLARPHVLSWLLTVIWFQILDNAENHYFEKDHIEKTASSRLFWLPILTLLWVNVHGGFLLGFALLALYLVSALVSYFRSSGRERHRIGNWLKKLSTVSGFSLLASFANPYGYKLHVHIYQYLSDRWLMSHIDEFQSPNFHGVAQECFAALLVVTIVALASARKKLALSHFFVIIFVTYSGLYASRNLPVSSILLTLIVAPVLSQSAADASTNLQLPARVRAFFARCESFASRMGLAEQQFRSHLWPAAAIIVGLWVCWQHGTLGSSTLMNAHFDDRHFPVQAAELIAEREIHEPIFSPDTWGGYLVYRLYPQTKVFVDDRHDFYGAEFFKQYLKAIRVTPDWDGLLNQRRVNWVLVPSESSLANMLKVTGRWTVVHEDETAVLFQRSEPI